MKKFNKLAIYTVMTALLCYLHQKSKAQDISLAAQQPVKENKTFTPVVILETWETYSMDEEKNNSSYANRFNTHLRRIRLGASGQLNPWLKYSLTLHYDRLGEDIYAATKGSCKGIGLWNAYITAKLLKSSELLNLHAGYFWAAISREYNTSPWAVSSFDKTYSVWYLRNFVTGKGNGIESGIGFGGLKNFNNKTGISYRIGVYNPEAYTSPKYANPLFTGRLMITLGDPEQKHYKYMLSGNQWRKRKGITLGFGTAYQGKTDNAKRGSDSIFFDKSISYGTDLLINYSGLSIDGEYFLMKRSAKNYTAYDGTEWHIRIAYSFAVKNQFLEPSFMTCNYSGDGAKKLYKYIGNDIVYDLGINWYIKKDKVKLSLHYVAQEGSVSPNTGFFAGAAFLVKL